jgi:hypothetical protein
MQELLDDHYAGKEINPTGFANSMNYRNDMKNWSTWKSIPRNSILTRLVSAYSSLFGLNAALPPVQSLSCQTFPLDFPARTPSADCKRRWQPRLILLNLQFARVVVNLMI